MKLVELKCKSCGAELKIDKDNDIGICPYCRSKYKIDDDDDKNKKDEFDKEEKKTQFNNSNMAKNKVLYIILFVWFAIFAFVIIVNIIRIRININGNITGNVTSSISTRANNTSNSKEKVMSDSEKKSFNLKYEMYSGTSAKIFVDAILDNVVTNNKKNKDKIITVKYNQTETNNPDEIIKLKKELNSNKKYEVILDYGDNGLVNKVTLED